MTKKFVFVAMAVAVVLAAGALWLAHRVPQQPESQSQAELKLQPLIAYNTLPTEVELAIGDQTTTYCFDEATQQFGAKGYDPLLRFDQNKLQKLFTSLSALNSRTLIERQPTELAPYGLDKPAVVATATYADGKRHVVRVGSRSPLEDGYYGMVDDQPAVQLLLSYDVDSFLTSRYDYRTPELLPLLSGEENEYVVEVLELELQRKAEGELRLYREASSPDAVALAEPLWITAPVQIEADQYLFTDRVVKGLFALMRTLPTIVEDMPEDLAIYGLDSPEKLHLRDSQNDVMLFIGKTEDERVYVMREGIPSVLSVNQSLFDFFRVRYEDIMSRLIWIHNIKDVAALKIVVDGVAYNLDTTNSVEDKFLLDGRAVAETEARSLFVAALSAQIEQRLPDDQRPGAMVCELTMVYKDGAQHLLTFFALNERQTAFAREGKDPEFYCASQQVKNIVEALKAL